MEILINTLYATLTWIAAFYIGFDIWLGWALLAMAVLQSLALLVTALRQL
jgi:hypothetical protein